MTPKPKQTALAKTARPKAIAPAKNKAEPARKPREFNQAQLSIIDAVSEMIVHGSTDGELVALRHPPTGELVALCHPPTRARIRRISNSRPDVFFCCHRNTCLCASRAAVLLTANRSTDCNHYGRNATVR